MRIEIRHNKESFYGVGEYRSQRAVEEAYEKLIDAEISKMYPQSKVEHCWGWHYDYPFITIFIGEQADALAVSRVYDVVSSVKEEVYNKGAFWHVQLALEDVLEYRQSNDVWTPSEYVLRKGWEWQGEEAPFKLVEAGSGYPLTRVFRGVVTDGTNVVPCIKTVYWRGGPNSGDWYQEFTQE
jgi:hypothetical protein